MDCPGGHSAQLALEVVERRGDGVVPLGQTEPDRRPIDGGPAAVPIEGKAEMLSGMFQSDDLVRCVVNGDKDIERRPERAAVGHEGDFCEIETGADQELCPGVAPAGKYQLLLDGQSSPGLRKIGRRRELVDNPETWVDHVPSGAVANAMDPWRFDLDLEVAMNAVVDPRRREGDFVVPGGVTDRPLDGERRVVGFDVSELSPLEGLSYPQYSVAKLIYRLIGYIHMK